MTTPTTVSAGDRLVMALTVNSSGRVLSDPTGITGWTVLSTTTSGSMQTRIYTKVADAADANKKVTVTLDAAAKYTMTVAAYSGVRTKAPVDGRLAETVTHTGHAPRRSTPAGTFVASYWADKSTPTTGFTLPGRVTGRSRGLRRPAPSTSAARSRTPAGAVPTGQYAGLVATADAASNNGDECTIMMRPRRTTAADRGVHPGVRQLGCEFDRSVERPRWHRRLVRLGLR